MTTAAATPSVPPAHRRRRGAALREVLHPIEGKLGATILLLYFFVAFVGPLLAPYDPDAITSSTLATPSSEHLLGTDNLGRDVLSRMLYGGASVIWLPLIATSLAFFAGALAGIAAGYAGGWRDTLTTRALDVLLALPPLLLILVVITALGSSSTVLVIAIALLFFPRIARVLRGATQAVCTSEYVQAAQARGEGILAISFREVLPNILPTALVEFAIRLTYAIIIFATLNFLGLGLQPPSSNWAVMVSESRATIGVAPWATLAPAIAIGAVSVGTSLIADAVTQRFGVRASVELGG